MNNLSGIANLTGLHPLAMTAMTPVQSNQDSGPDFSSAMNDALREQTIQSIMSSMNGSGGLNMSSGIFMPPATAGLENTMVAAAQSGEMSGAHLMLFMMMMMMQSGEGAINELAPIMQMVAAMLSQSTRPPDNTPDLNVYLAETQNSIIEYDETEPGIRRMIDAALGQVGYHERNRDGSIGNGNMTQFGAWYGMDGQPWCAMFVSWAADQAGILNDVVPRHASTSMGVGAYQNKGLYSPRSSGYQPREGDAIYFQNPATGRIQHVGIVVAYDSAAQRVYTVEGNTNNAVRIRHYEINNPRIHGYGRNGGTGNGMIPVNSTAGSGANYV